MASRSDAVQDQRLHRRGCRDVSGHDSLHPNFVGGPTYILYSGATRGGKTYAANRSVEINGLPSSDTTIAPEQMGEGGMADVLTKTWNAIKAKNFKTSPLQLMGAILRDRMLQGRNLPGYPNGVLNHVTKLDEAQVDKPEYHRIMKLDDAPPPGDACGCAVNRRATWLSLYTIGPCTRSS